jgi:hypothetical protein
MPRAGTKKRTLSDLEREKEQLSKDIEGKSVAMYTGLKAGTPMSIASSSASAGEKHV